MSWAQVGKVLGITAEEAENMTKQFDEYNTNVDYPTTANRRDLSCRGVSE